MVSSALCSGDSEGLQGAMAAQLGAAVGGLGAWSQETGASNTAMCRAMRHAQGGIEEEPPSAPINLSTGGSRRTGDVLSLHADASATLDEIIFEGMSIGHGAPGPGVDRGKQARPLALIRVGLTHQGKVMLEDVHVRDARVNYGSIMAFESGYPAQVTLNRVSVKASEADEVVRATGVGSLTLNGCDLELPTSGNLVTGLNGLLTENGVTQKVSAATP